MSHFSVAVVVPNETYKKGEVYIKDYIQDLLDPFSEHLEVEPYKNPCYTCKGTKINALEYSKNFGKPCDEEDCDENGEYTTTYNPKSKWDWYRIGGRWNGEIVNNVPVSTDNGFNFGADCESLELNSISINKLLETRYERYVSESNPDGVFSPFAILTPESDWIEHGKMGWWAIVSDKTSDEEWNEITKAVFNRYKNEYAVLLDCHI